MKKSANRRSLLLLSTIFLMFGNSFGQNAGKIKESLLVESPFRYVIAHNQIDPSLGGDDEERRMIEVALEKKSFSEKNLTVLFRLLSARFPRPNLLFVNVFADLADIETPEESDQGKISGQDIPAKSIDTAVFTRSDERMFYYMNSADGDFDEVVIRP